MPFGLPIPFFSKLTPQYPDDNFEGTITSTQTINTATNGDKWTRLQPSPTTEAIFTLTGTGTKRVQILLVGGGGVGSAASNNASGVGGNGGQIISQELFLTPGTYYLLLKNPSANVWEVGFNRGTASKPWDIEAIQGGGASGGTSVSGSQNGNNGTPGITSSITDTPTRYGWAGGSGAVIDSSLIDTLVERFGGSGGGGGLGDDGGFGGDGKRLSTNFIEPAQDAQTGVNFGDGGGGGASVYAKQQASPFNFRWHNLSGAAGRGGVVIIRWKP
jgi:hypothetical protein